MISTTISGAVSSPSEAESSFCAGRDIEKRVGSAAPKTEGKDRLPPIAPKIVVPGSRVSTAALDIDLETNHSPRQKREPQASFWSRVSRAATVVEEHLAEWFGLNDSKYQWAVDEAINRQLAGESQMKRRSSESPKIVRMEPLPQQTMDNV